MGAFTFVSCEDQENYNSFFQQILKDLTENPDYLDMPETNHWFSKVLKYNVLGGKQTRGLTTVLACRHFCPETKSKEENVKLSYILGWCVEIFQSYFLVVDDIMDSSETRRGRPCWYKTGSCAGSIAINDAFLMESSIYMLLNKYFRNKSYYTDLVDIMHDINAKTIYGQSLDTQTGLRRHLDSYTMELYKSIVKYKTSFYSFYLPVALAMIMNGISDPDLIEQVKTVTLEIGHYFQVQDDYLDCFGDNEITGKLGTDIQDCKCTWLFIKAIERCTIEQKVLLYQNYGKNDAPSVENVKKLYIELGLKELYLNYEDQQYGLITKLIAQKMSDKLPKDLFVQMLKNIYRRNS